MRYKEENVSMTEQDFLSSYSIEDYDRPSLTADIVIFSISEEDTRESFRKPFDIALKLLLIKRGEHPYKGRWALPGGFCVRDEEVSETAARKLYEEAGISRANLSLIDIHSKRGRDPRGWIISSAFMALVDKDKSVLRAGKDAWEACWFAISLELVGRESKLFDKYIKKPEPDVNLYKLVLSSENSSDYEHEPMEHFIIEKSVKKEHIIRSEYKLAAGDSLAFDHALIICSALNKLKKAVEDNPKLIFDLMPEEFTLTQLQTAFEIILDKKLLTANFRRKIADYVVETEHIREGAGFRPAKLYRRKL